MTIAQQKIKLAFESSDLSEFRFTDCTFGGDECVLVNPIAFPKYNSYNKYLRSVIYRKLDYKILSAGFPKFTNWLEKPDIFPVPTQISECQIVTKLDGSLLCISKYKDSLIIRTRGSCNIDKCLNNNEIELFKLKYPKFFNSILDGYTYLAEWVSPLQRIVLNYNEPDIYLIGLINNNDYSLTKQDDLNILALDLGVKRPEMHSFLSFDDLFKSIENKTNFEGYCIYSNNGQSIHKVKTNDYLIKHRFKEKLNYESMVDYFLLNKDITIEEQIDKIGKEIDFECATQAKVFLLDIDKKYKNILKTFEDIKSQVSNYKDKPRKELALFVKQSYNGPFQGIAFSFFEGKSVDDKKLTQLLND
jgi:hypothetical protein